MHRLLNIVSALVVVLLTVGCASPKRSVEMHDTKRSVWSEREDFYYDNTDTLSHREISVVVRYGMGYVADSVALSVLCVSPDSLVVEETFTLHIPHLSDMRPEVQSFPYRRNVVLREKGRYLFRLRPHESIEGISSVGLVIGEIEQNR
ncbi:MAG: hypothetical protein IKV06_05305 [Alistipes sp.]|nr:hypothetical protein [Alistipes sp.]